MGSKILRKLAVQIQPSTSFVSNAMTQMAFSDGIINQGFDPIEDDGILGVGFNNTPLQGPRHVGGNYSLNVDVDSIETLLQASLGGVNSDEYYFNGSHDTRLSIAELNSVNCIRYTSCYSKSLKLSGAKGGLVKADVELFSIAAQDRQATSAFPSPTAVAGIPLSFHEMGGTNGYFRIGDQANPLASGDNLKVESFGIEITSGFDESFANENDDVTPSALGSLIPTWGMVQPGVKFNFKIPKYVTAQFQTWADANTALQAEIYIYKSATKNLTIRIPNLVIKPTLESGDLTSLSVEASVGRNGIGASFVNSNMAFNSPIKFIVTKS